MTTSIWPCGGFYQQSEKDSRTAKTRLLPFNTLRRHLYTMGLIDSPWCRRCEQGRKPQLTFCVSVKPWRHSDVTLWVHFSWTLRMSGLEGNKREQGFHDISLRNTKGLPKAYVHQHPKGSNPFVILFYSIQSWTAYCVLTLRIPCYHVYVRVSLANLCTISLYTNTLNYRSKVFRCSSVPSSCCPT